MNNSNSWFNLHQPMLENQIYHIFNQGNNGEVIFKNKENKNYFKSKLYKYISPFADVLAECLMSDHYHLLIRIKPYKEVAEHVHKVKGLYQVIKRHKAIGKRNEISIIISEMLRRCFMSYAKAFNKMYNRLGSLFRKNFRRKLITSEKYLKNIWIYIHKNPQKHKYIEDYRKSKSSSYSNYLHSNIKNLYIKMIFNKIFINIDLYIKNHEQYIQSNDDDIVIIE
ncbi:MAG: transposase [Bacteroidales bacterium]|jgi:REP element-mobilizing transposase RayT|nr:transposase [Bacteroidales bacterium]